MRFIGEMRWTIITAGTSLSLSLSPLVSFISDEAVTGQKKREARRGLISREKTFHSTSVPEQFIFKETVGPFSFFFFLRHVTEPSSESSPFGNATFSSRSFLPRFFLFVADMSCLFPAKKAGAAVSPPFLI